MRLSLWLIICHIPRSRIFSASRNKIFVKNAGLAFYCGEPAFLWPARTGGSFKQCMGCSRNNLQFFRIFCHTSAPLSVIRTSSSIWTGCSRDVYAGFDCKKHSFFIIQGIGSVIEGYLWTVIPSRCPRRRAKYSPKPAPVLMFLAVKSTSAQLSAALLASIAVSWLFKTMS